MSPDALSPRPPYLCYALCIPGASYLVLGVVAQAHQVLSLEFGEGFMAIGTLSAVGAYFSPPLTVAAAILNLVRPAPEGHRLLRWVAVACAAIGWAFFARLFLVAT